MKFNRFFSCVPHAISLIFSILHEYFDSFHSVGIEVTIQFDLSESFVPIKLKIISVTAACQAAQALNP